MGLFPRGFSEYIQTCFHIHIHRPTGR